MISWTGYTTLTEENFNAFSLLQSRSIVVFIQRQMSKLNYIDGDAKHPLKVLFSSGGKQIEVNNKCEEKCVLCNIWISVAWCFCFSAWSSSQESGGRSPQLHCPEGDLEASSDSEAAWPDQRVPAGLLQATERGTSWPASHHGCFPA